MPACTTLLGVSLALGAGLETPAVAGPGAGGTGALALAAREHAPRSRSATRTERAAEGTTSVRLRPVVLRDDLLSFEGSSRMLEHLAVPLTGPRLILPHSRGCDGCGATGAQAVLDPTRPVDGRGSLFYGIEALTREVSTVHVMDHDYQIEPVLVLGNPGIAVARSF